MKSDIVKYTQNQTSPNLTASRRQGPEARGFFGGVGFVSEVTGILDFLHLVPHVSDQESAAQWEEAQSKLDQILQGQLEIKDAINDALESGQQMGDVILSALENGLNDINGQLTDISNQISMMQASIMHALSSFHRDMMNQFANVNRKQDIIIDKLRVIESFLLELMQQVNELSGKVDWNNVVTLLGPHLQRVEYLYDCFVNLPAPVAQPGSKSGLAMVDYFRMREWARAVMDFNSGMPLALDAIHRLIMGTNPLVPSMFRTLSTLLRLGVFPQGGSPAPEVLRDYYKNLAILQVKGGSCIGAACEILRISNSYEDLLAVRIEQQLEFVLRSIDAGGFKDTDLVPSPKEGSRYVHEFILDGVPYGGVLTESYVWLGNMKNMLGGDATQWAVVNFRPFTADGTFHVCVARMLPNYRVDQDSYQWLTIKVGNFHFEHLLAINYYYNTFPQSDILSVSTSVDRIPFGHVCTGFYLGIQKSFQEDGTYLFLNFVLLPLYNPCKSPLQAGWTNDRYTRIEVHTDQQLFPGTSKAGRSVGTRYDARVAGTEGSPLTAFELAIDETGTHAEISFKASTRYDDANMPPYDRVDLISVPPMEVVFEEQRVQTTNVSIRKEMRINITDLSYLLGDVTKWTFVDLIPFTDRFGMVKLCLGKLKADYTVDPATLVWMDYFPVIVNQVGPFGAKEMAGIPDEQHQLLVQQAHHTIPEGHYAVEVVLWRVAGKYENANSGETSYCATGWSIGSKPRSANGAWNNSVAFTWSQFAVDKTTVGVEYAILRDIGAASTPHRYVGTDLGARQSCAAEPASLTRFGFAVTTETGPDGDIHTKLSLVP